MDGPGSFDMPDIVGIGVSAGGLRDLRALAGAIVPGSGAAYVVAQPFAADKGPITGALLSGAVPFPVVEIHDGLPIRADHLYIAPAGRTLAIAGDTFRLGAPSEMGGYPIDDFLFSLAAVRGRDAVCVVLAGTGGDGAAGVRAVREAGGCALAGEGGEADPGPVEETLPSARLWPRVRDAVAQRQALRDDDLRSAIEAQLSRVMHCLGKVSGRDVSGCRPGALVRRIERRMAIRRMRDVAAFVDGLEHDAGQAGELAAEALETDGILGEVGAVRALHEHVVPALAAEPARTVRVWVPGCGAGEEAYAIAALLSEALTPAGHRVQVFGTDDDAAALARAREGRFAQEVIAAMPGDVGRFFPGGQAEECLRDTCLFSMHDLARDAVPEGVDLVVCRAALEKAPVRLHHHIMPRLHGALVRGGHIYTGGAAGPFWRTGLFEAVDAEACVLRKRPREAGELAAQMEAAPGATGRRLAAFETLAATAPVGLALVSSDMDGTWVNGALAGLAGQPGIARSDAGLSALPEGLAEEVEDGCRRAAETGAPLVGVELGGSVAEDPGELRRWSCDFQPVREGEEVLAVAVTFREVTQERRLSAKVNTQAAHRRFLLAELQHRVKNTLATVKAVARLLVLPGEPSSRYQKRLTQRLNALSRTHDLLTENDWRAVPLSRLVASELGQYRRAEGAVQVTGPDIPIAVSEAVAVGIALGELAQNAARFGALSVDGGRVSVTMEQSGGRRFTWKETGGPPVAPDLPRNGFGTMVLCDIVARDVDGTAELAYEPDGVRFSLDFGEETDA